MRKILPLLLLMSAPCFASDKLTLNVSLTTECAVEALAPVAFGSFQWLGDQTAITQARDIRIDCPFDTAYTLSFSQGSGWDPVLRSRFLTLNGGGDPTYRIPYEIERTAWGLYLLPHSVGSIANYYGQTGGQFPGTFTNGSMAPVLSTTFRVRGTATNGTTLPRAPQFPYIAGTYQDRITVELVF